MGHRCPHRDGTVYLLAVLSHLPLGIRATPLTSRVSRSQSTKGLFHVRCCKLYLTGSDFVYFLVDGFFFWSGKNGYVVHDRNWKCIFWKARITHGFVGCLPDSHHLQLRVARLIRGCQKMPTCDTLPRLRMWGNLQLTLLLMSCPVVNWSRLVRPHS